MTEAEIERVINESEETLRSAGTIAPVLLCVLAGYFLVCGLLVQTLLASYLSLAGLVISFGLAVSIVYSQSENGIP